MEAASLPLAAFGFLSRPPPEAATACCSRRNLSCVCAALQALEAHEASKPPQPSPRRNAVAEVKAAPDPVAALTRFEDVLQTQDCNIILRHYGDTRSWDELSKVLAQHNHSGFYRQSCKKARLMFGKVRVIHILHQFSNQTMFSWGAALSMTMPGLCECST